MSEGKKEQNQDYVLGIARHANSRLNLQHFLMMHAFNNELLDERIPCQAPNLRIADICCGTGVWLSELRRFVHPSTTFYALDINPSNLPPTPWLPASTTARQYSIFDPPPPDLLGTFDIINVQLTLTFVKDSTFPSVLDNLLAFLKPGGWIQWTEDTITDITVHSPDPAYNPTWMADGIKMAWDLFQLQQPTWIPHLAEHFTARDLVNVETININEPDKTMLRPWMEQHWMGFEETEVSCLRLMGDGEENQKRVKVFRDHIEKMYVEFKERGVCIWVPLTRAIGQKPA